MCIEKQLKTEVGIPELEEKAAEMESEKANLELELQELRSKFDMMEKRENERRLADEKRRKEELEFCGRLSHEHELPNLEVFQLTQTFFSL